MPSISLANPLKTLVQACEVRCGAMCCKAESFDFSQTLIAPKLLGFSGEFSATIFQTVLDQLHSLDIEYGIQGRLSNGTEIKDLCAQLSGYQITGLVAEISSAVHRSAHWLKQNEAAENQRRKAYSQLMQADQNNRKTPS